MNSTFGNYPYLSDLGDGTFQNPVLLADYSDPDVIRCGKDFYMIASSFNATPGIPILKSSDLVNWELINHAVKNLPGDRYGDFHAGSGVWAPSIRFQDDRFWIFFPMVDEGIYVITAEDPAGIWSEPHCLLAGKGLIDPCPFWDEDGLAYLVHAYANSRSGIKEKLHVRPMSRDGRTILGEGKIVVHAPQHPYLEGPKFHKLNGWYYLLAPGGGVQTGWQVAFRSREIYGPYEEKIVLERGSTAINGPHQGALVDLPNGEWWFFHFQDLGLYGRVVHLQPVVWHDDWPLIGIDFDKNGVGEPVTRAQKPGINPGSRLAGPATSDEFDHPKLGLQWQWHANHHDDWFSLEARPNWLRLFSQPRKANGLGFNPNLLLQKLPARSFVVETDLEIGPGPVGEEAGLVLQGREWASLSLRRGEEGIELVFSLNGVEKQIQPWASTRAQLKLAMQDGGLCTFSTRSESNRIVLMPELFQAREGDWMGAKVGLFAVGKQVGLGHADFDFFRFFPL